MIADHHISTPLVEHGMARLLTTRKSTYDLQIVHRTSSIPRSYVLSQGSPIPLRTIRMRRTLRGSTKNNVPVRAAYASPVTVAAADHQSPSRLDHTRHTWGESTSVRASGRVHFASQPLACNQLLEWLSANLSAMTSKRPRGAG